MKTNSKPGTERKYYFTFWLILSGVCAFAETSQSFVQAGINTGQTPYLIIGVFVFGFAVLNLLRINDSKGNKKQLHKN